MHGAEPNNDVVSEDSILLVGDWVVDDSWQTGVYRSETSLRQGSQHFRAESHVAPVVAFCAAGRLASILRGPDKEPRHRIDGLGVWHESDTDVLHSMFDFDYRCSLSPDKLKVEALPESERPIGIALHNLGPKTSTTTHAVRTYTRSSGRMSIHDRTDWESHLEHNDHLPRLEEWLGTFNGGIKAVVIKDILKGVVTTALVDKLIERFSDAPWFVSTKQWNADWLKALKRVNLKVLFVPPVAAKCALESFEHVGDSDTEPAAIDSWISPTIQQPTKGGMVAIDRLENLVYGQSKRGDVSIVIGPEEGKAVAKSGAEYVVEVSESTTDYSVVGWATAFFASLVNHGLCEGTDSSSLISFGIKDAIDYAYNWAKVEAGYLRTPRSHPVATPTPLTNVSQTNAQSMKWQDAEDEWKAATHDKGIINSKGEARIELWRGMTLLDGYICFEKQKRLGIARLLRILKKPPPSDSNQQQAIQIIAEPGSGKSYLVKCLAKAANLELCEFNITHLMSREDLVSCFDKIATMQAESRYRPLLVFFDEINALIDGNPVYDAFLSPLEDSIYLRKLLKFRLMPCFWLFAGTEPDASTNKYADFANRMIETPVNLGPLSPLERSYAGAQLIRQQFPDVISISDAVLDKISKVEGSVREIKRFVRRLKDVRNSEVRRKNIPGETDQPEKMVSVI